MLLLCSVRMPVCFFVRNQDVSHIKKYWILFLLLEYFSMLCKIKINWKVSIQKVTNASSLSFLFAPDKKRRPLTREAQLTTSKWYLGMTSKLFHATSLFFSCFWLRGCSQFWTFLQVNKLARPPSWRYTWKCWHSNLVWRARCDRKFWSHCSSWIDSRNKYKKKTLGDLFCENSI